MSTKKNSGFSSSSVMADLLASAKVKIPSLRRGSEVVGKVVSVSNSEVLVDVGAKSEGIISGRELSSGRELLSAIAVGDSIDAVVLYPENDAGQVVLSLKKLSGEKRWGELEERKKNGEDAEVVIIEANRGGLICDFAGLHGFLPASQLATVPSKLESLIGKTLSVKIIEVDRVTNRLIFTQKSHNKRDLGNVLALLDKVAIGDKYEGVVSAILPFGMFVEINLDKPKSKTKEKAEESKGAQKLEGLVHISEISWDKIDDAAKMFKVGDKVEVLVIAKDKTEGRLNLSIKQLLPDPFAQAAQKYTKDMKVKGVVARVTPFGIFVNLEEGIEGLIHISKVSPNATYNAGDKVECEIESVDTASRKIALVPIAKEKPVLYR